MASEPIMVVDDNPTNLKLMEVALGAAGYEVRGAADAEDALAQVKKDHPRLIMMDVQLPGMDGLELTRRLKGDPATRDIVIVATTAYAMAGDELRAKEAGCDGYVAKPINTRTLADQVSAYLDREAEGTDGVGEAPRRS